MKKFVPLLAFVMVTSQAGELISRDMLCDDTSVIIKELKTKYKEIPVITGLVSDEAGSLLSIWTNPETDSWTIVATKGNDSCIIGIGEKFKVIDYSKRKNT